MNRVFLSHAGEVVDVLRHTKEVIEKHSLISDVKIYVGCDSQNKRWSTSYVGVIAFRYGARGTHYIYTKDNVPKIKDRWPRLAKEVELALEIANYLKDNGVAVYCIDFDFNSKEIARSHDLVQWAQGWAVSLGYNCTVKPEEQIASRAADHIVKLNDGRNRKKFRRQFKKVA